MDTKRQEAGDCRFRIGWRFLVLRPYMGDVLGWYQKLVNREAAAS